MPTMDRLVNPPFPITHAPGNVVQEMIGVVGLEYVAGVELEVVGVVDHVRRHVESQGTNQLAGSTDPPAGAFRRAPRK